MQVGIEIRSIVELNRYSCHASRRSLLWQMTLFTKFTALTVDDSGRLILQRLRSLVWKVDIDRFQLQMSV